MTPTAFASSATGTPASPALQVLRISASPRGAQSESLRLSQQILEALAARSALHVGPPITLTELDTNLLAPVDAAYAAALAARADPATPPASGSALYRSDALIAQLDAADVVVIATPMHNFTVPSALKAWVDHIVRVRATFAITPQGKTGTLRDRPVYVAVSSGGFITGERARQPDFLQPYLRVALATVGLHDVQFFSVEGTALGDAALESGRAQAQAAVAAALAL